MAAGVLDPAVFALVGAPLWGRSRSAWPRAGACAPPASAPITPSTTGAPTIPTRALAETGESGAPRFIAGEDAPPSEIAEDA